MTGFSGSPRPGAAVALVTGAGTGIGAALAVALSSRGWRVVVIDREREAAERIAGSIPGAMPACLDVRDRPGWHELVAAVERDVGAVGLLVNNAGVAAAGPFEQLPPDDWQRLIDVNLLGVVHGIGAVYPTMLQRGSGVIINVASGAGLFARPGMSAYAASKAAVVGLTRALHAEAAARGVHVMAACPGYIGTGIMSRTEWRGVDGAAIVSAIPIRPMSPAKCAERILSAAGSGRAIETIGGGLWLEGMLARYLPAVLHHVARARARAFDRHRLPPSGAQSPGTPSGK